MNFNHANAHPRDTRLTFRAEDHTYHVGDQELRPVTSVVESCFEPFDVEKWAPRIAARRGVPEQVLRDEWEEKGRQARDQGTLMHQRIERFYLGDPDPLADEDPTYKLFRQFAAEHTLHPYRTEWAVYDEDLGVAGTIDFLDCSKGQFTIIDWKRSDKLVADGEAVTTNRYGDCALPPLTDLQDTTYWHYALQVSIYRFILERKYGIRVSHCCLAVFHPSNERHYLLRMPYLRDHVCRLFRLPAAQ